MGKMGEVGKKEKASSTTGILGLLKEKGGKIKF